MHVFIGYRYYCIVYLVFVGEFKKNVTRQTWQALFNFGEYLFQSTRHFGECLKKMVSHIVDQQIPNRQYSNVQQFILQILTSH
jgi:hypothetical protein